MALRVSECWRSTWKMGPCTASKPKTQCWPLGGTAVHTFRARPPTLVPATGMVWQCGPDCLIRIRSLSNSIPPAFTVRINFPPDSPRGSAIATAHAIYNSHCVQNRCSILLPPSRCHYTRCRVSHDRRLSGGGWIAPQQRRRTLHGTVRAIGQGLGLPRCRQSRHDRRDPGRSGCWTQERPRTSNFVVSGGTPVPSWTRDPSVHITARPLSHTPALPRVVFTTFYRFTFTWIICLPTCWRNDCLALARRRPFLLAWMSPKSPSPSCPPCTTIWVRS